MLSADVVIVGCGIIGAAVAYALSRTTSLRIIVLERGLPGCEASGAAAGVLAVASVRARRGALFDLRRASAALFPDLVGALQDEVGAAIAYHRNGLLSLAFSAAQAHDLEALVQHRTAQGLRAVWLDRESVIAAEPAVNPEVWGAALFPDDGTIDAVQLIEALVTAARRRGVTFRLDTAVHSVEGRGGAATVRFDGDRIEAGRAVVAAGAWSGEIFAPHGVKVPVRPARGEMAALRPVGWRVHHILSQGDGYLIPRDSGDVLIAVPPRLWGSTSASHRRAFRP